MKTTKEKVEDKCLKDAKNQKQRTDPDLIHVGYVADREPTAHEIVKDGLILTWSDA